MKNPSVKETIIKAVIKNRVVLVDLASEIRGSYQDMAMDGRIKYLGSGYYYSYTTDGIEIKATDPKLTHFWVRKKGQSDKMNAPSNIKGSQLKPIECQYSGTASKNFWETVSQIKDKSDHQEIYSLGVALQNMEDYVLKQLHFAQTLNKKSKNK